MMVISVSCVVQLLKASAAVADSPSFFGSKSTDDAPGLIVDEFFACFEVFDYDFKLFHEITPYS